MPGGPQDRHCPRSRSPARDRHGSPGGANAWHAGTVAPDHAASLLPDHVTTGDGTLDRFLLDLTSVSGDLESALASMPRAERRLCIEKASKMDNLKNISLWTLKWARNVRERQRRFQQKTGEFKVSTARTEASTTGQPSHSPRGTLVHEIALSGPSAPAAPPPPPQPPGQRLPLSQSLRSAAPSSMAASPSPAPSPLPLVKEVPTRHRVPQWVVEAWQAWAQNKTLPCLKAVSTAVQEPVLGELMELPMREQVAIAVSLMMLPQAHTDPTGLAKVLLKIRGQLAQDTKPGSAPVAPAPSPSPRTVHYMEWHLCCGCGITLYCMELAKHVVKGKLPDVTLRPARVICFENDPDVRAVLQAVAESMGLQVQIQDDVNKFPGHAETMKTSYPQAATLNAVLASPPCLVTSNCNKYSLHTRTALHTPPSNCVWACHKGMVMLSDDDSKKLAYFKEHVNCRLPDDEVTLDKLFQPRFITDRSEAEYHASKRSRTLRTVPSIRETPAEMQFPAPVPDRAHIDGWTWLGNWDGTFGALKITIRSHIVVLVEEALDPEHEFEEYERQTLASLRMQNELGEQRLVSTDFYYRWMGHEKGSPVREVLDKLYPCYGQIYPATGLTAGPGRGEPCGKSRYCYPCGKIIGMLGQSWDVRTMTDYLAAWLMKVVMTWTDAPGSQEIAWSALDKSMCHDCQRDCPLNLVKADLAGAGA